MTVYLFRAKVGLNSAFSNTFIATTSILETNAGGWRKYYTRRSLHRKAGPRFGFLWFRFSKLFHVAINLNRNFAKDKNS